MPADGRSCSTCAHHHVARGELGFVVECRSQAPAVQARPSALGTEHRDAMADAAAASFDLAEDAYELGDDSIGEAALNVSLAVAAIGDDDLAVERWPLVRPDDWCGQHTPVAAASAWRGAWVAAQLVAALIVIVAGIVHLAGPAG